MTPPASVTWSPPGSTRPEAGFDPDLVVIAEGVNSLWAGMPLATYAADLEGSVGEVILLA